MTLSVGVIGTGMIGRDHIRRLTQVLSGVKIVAATDIDRGRAEAAVPDGAEVFDTPRALIQSDKVQAIVICSWGPAHEEQLLACIAAGKPVFCEKPMVTSEAAALRVIEAEIASGRRLVQVGFMRRFDADYRRLKAVINGGTLGAPLMYHSVHRNASVPAGLYTSEMPLNDTLVHDADISRWLLSDEITGVEVRLPRRSRQNEELRDPHLVLLHMGSGAIVDVEISVNIAYGYDIRGEVSCELGVAALPNRPATVISDAHGIRQAIPEDWRERFIEAYDQEFREWIAAAAAGTATGPSAWDGYAATLTADAALRAVASGGLERISMIEKPRLYEIPAVLAAEQFGAPFTRAGS
ncbi:Gfo/Idh/MocA family protein [Mesorhizobium delmotii]|uniref:Inositol 2-dehydrogenase n=1 Tax=Mesorhizobium delmotii TaxID=1631247 RepID=A0A2P9AD78_9HYPH|nr:Gfo/Idh/MocA family oxidoreductase [Mesorhizobium delmotii]SJM29070.1 Inositol 2-dehydrogenase [Mesorhizobium delmotii]